MNNSIMRVSVNVYQMEKWPHLEGGMVYIVIVVLYFKYRLSPHECSVYPLKSAVQRN